MTWDLIQAFFLFVLVLVLVWWTTRLVGYRMGAAARGRLVKVLEYVPAGRDRTVMLLEVGGRIYLVGSTGQQISLLDAIDDPETIRRILENVPEPLANPLAAALPPSFQEVLNRVRNRIVPAPRGQEGAGEELDNLQQQIERLRRLQQK